MNFCGFARALVRTARLLLLLLLPALFLFAPCGQAFTKTEPTENAPGKETVIPVGMEDNGKEIGLSAGDVVLIGLETLGSAGYLWHFDSLDEGFLEMISSGTRVLSDRTGAPVVSEWRLRARKAGLTKIVMSNYRPWEGREKAVGRFVLRIRIR